MVIICFCLFAASIARAEAADDFDWQELETKYTVIRYLSDDDLMQFDEKIVYSAASSSSGLKWLLSSSDTGDQKERIGNKVDALFRRAQEILGMRKKMDKVRINVYNDKIQLKEAFLRIYQKEGNYRAWYIFEYNTVYITIADLHEGMLAHELAHAIIDHYMTVRPPPQSAEILARYVDSHLLKQ